MTQGRSPRRATSTLVARRFHRRRSTRPLQLTRALVAPRVARSPSRIPRRRFWPSTARRSPRTIPLLWPGRVRSRSLTSWPHAGRSPRATKCGVRRPRSWRIRRKPSSVRSRSRSRGRGARRPSGWRVTAPVNGRGGSQARGPRTATRPTTRETVPSAASSARTRRGSRRKTASGCGGGPGRARRLTRQRSAGGAGSRTTARACVGWAGSPMIPRKRSSRRRRESSRPSCASWCGGERRDCPMTEPSWLATPPVDRPRTRKTRSSRRTRSASRRTCARRRGGGRGAGWGWRSRGTHSSSHGICASGCGGGRGSGWSRTSSSRAWRISVERPSAAVAGAVDRRRLGLVALDGGRSDDGGADVDELTPVLPEAEAAAFDGDFEELTPDLAQHEESLRGREFGADTEELPVPVGDAASRPRWTR